MFTIMTASGTLLVYKVQSKQHKNSLTDKIQPSTLEANWIKNK